ncbi:MAG: SGNH/GDSL hydrolase family protein [Bacteroidaceae bacterium]|nr:SGNH/GDSL hydrolase family protein [Bacteroidaceae bacterium]
MIFISWLASLYSCNRADIEVPTIEFVGDEILSDSRSEDTEGWDSVVIKDFSSFSKSAGWVISDDMTTAKTHIVGVENRLISGVVTHEDKFNLSVSLIAKGKSFEVLVGKWAYMSGTMFGVRKDEEGSFITTYLIGSDSEQVLKNRLKLKNVSLCEGQRIYLEILKRTDVAGYYNVNVADEEGNIDTFIKVGLTDVSGGDVSNEGGGDYTGYAWGALCAYMLEGDSMEIDEFSFGYPVIADLKLIVLGHSYIEGNSIADNKDQRFAYLVCKEIGLDKTLILGQGGQTASALKQYVKNYAKWFSNAQYALISIGANDFYLNPTKSKMETCILDCEDIAKTLMSYNIIPVWIVDSGFLINNLEGKDQIKLFSDWLMQQDYYIDVRQCFRDAKGNNDPDAYLLDEKHPTIAVHHSIYEEIKNQADYLFQTEDKADYIKEIKY